jgi:hypothetical protein
MGFFQVVIVRNKIKSGFPIFNPYSLRFILLSSRASAKIFEDLEIPSKAKEVFLSKSKGPLDKRTISFVYSKR